MLDSTTVDLMDDMLQRAVIIAVMGLTGAGKSTFIQKATGDQDIEIGHEQASCTQDLSMYSFMHDGQPVVLIDTPGFDDTFRTDGDVLEQIADFLKVTYQKDYRLSGIVYLHDITENRLGHGGMNNLTVFKLLCGDEPLRDVVLATTMWEVLTPASIKVAEKRLEELTSKPQYWADMIQSGSTTERFENTRASALQLLQPLIDRHHPVTLQIQQEMAIDGQMLANTAAGHAVSEELVAKLEVLKAKIARQDEQIEAARQTNNKEMADFKEAQRRETKKVLREFQAQQAKLHAERGDEKRQFDMKMAQLKKTQKAYESEQIARLEAEIAEQTQMLKTERVDKAALEASINEKRAVKSRKEKWLAILSAVGTTGAAAGLSIINPSAIPIAINGFINLINVIFSRSKNMEQQDAISTTNAVALAGIAAS